MPWPRALDSTTALKTIERRPSPRVANLHGETSSRIGYVSSRVRGTQEAGAAPLNQRAMIDATIFALLVGAVATPISWWGLNRFG